MYSCGRSCLQNHFGPTLALPCQGNSPICKNITRASFHPAAMPVPESMKRQCSPCKGGLLCQTIFTSSSATVNGWDIFFHAPHTFLISSVFPQAEHSEQCYPYKNTKPCSSYFQAAIPNRFSLAKLSSPCTPPDQLSKPWS